MRIKIGSWRGGVEGALYICRQQNMRHGPAKSEIGGKANGCFQIFRFHKKRFCFGTRSIVPQPPTQYYRRAYACNRPISVCLFARTVLTIHVIRLIFQAFWLYLYEISDILRTKKTIFVAFQPRRVLSGLGENVKLARKRRRLTLVQVAERAGIARSTLGLIENGAPGVSMGAYLQVLFVLGLEKDLLEVAADDPLGRKLQDAGLLFGKRRS